MPEREKVIRRLKCLVKNAFKRFKKEGSNWDVLRCSECKYWYDDSGLSGLSAKECKKHGIMTKRGDWCSFAERR